MPYVSSCANAICPYVFMLSMHYIHFIRSSLSQCWLMCEVLLLLWCFFYCRCCCCCCVFSAVSLTFGSLSWRSSSHQLTNILLYERARSIARPHARTLAIESSEFDILFFVHCCCCRCSSLVRCVFSSSPILSCVHHSDPSSLFNWFGSLVGVRLVPFCWKFFFLCLFFGSLSHLRCVLILHTTIRMIFFLFG